MNRKAGSETSLLLGVLWICKMQPNGVHNARISIEANDTYESVDSVAKPASLLYSVKVAIFVRRKELLEL
jgi:hypothetical protein